MTLRNYTNTATEASLTGSVTSGDATYALTSFSGFPSAPFTAVIDRGTPSEEVVLVTSVSGSNVTTTRGYDGTTAKSHAAGATFLHVTVAKDYVEANAHVNVTTGAHGITGAPVGTTDVQTLTNKTLTAPVLTAATSSGTHAHASATFSGTVSVTGATTLGAVSAASASVTGSLTVTGATTLGALSASGTAALTALTATTGAFSGAVTVPALTASGVVTAPSFVATAAATTATQLIRKGEVDALGITAATPSTFVKRDPSGRIAAVDGAAAGDVATKGQMDTAIASAVTAQAAKIQVGAGNITTNGSGDFTVTHTLGVIPTAVFVQPRNVNAFGGNQYVVNAVTSTTFSGRAFYNGGPQGAASFAAYWMVVA